MNLFLISQCPSCLLAASPHFPQHFVQICPPSFVLSNFSLNLLQMNDFSGRFTIASLLQGAEPPVFKRVTRFIVRNRNTKKKKKLYPCRFRQLIPSFDVVKRQHRTQWRHVNQAMKIWKHWTPTYSKVCHKQLNKNLTEEARVLIWITARWLCLSDDRQSFSAFHVPLTGCHYPWDLCLYLSWNEIHGVEWTRVQKGLLIKGHFGESDCMGWRSGENHMKVVWYVNKIVHLC